MRPGKLRERIEIKRPIQSRTVDGGFINTFGNKITLWGRVSPLSGKELEIARRVSSLATHEIECRYVEGIRTNMKIDHMEKTYNIEFIQNVDSRNRQAKMLASEDVSDKGA